MSWLPFILLSALFVGLSDVTEKKALKKEHASAFLSASSILITLFSISFLLTGRVQVLDISMISLVFLRALFITLFFTFNVIALRHLDISEFAPLMNLSPIFLLFISITFLGEQLTIMHFFGIGLIIAGTYFLELKYGWKSPFRRIKNNKYIHFLLLAMVFASITAVLDKFILTKSISIETFYLYSRFFVTIFLLLISAIFYGGYKDVVKVYKNSFMWILIPSLLYFIGDYLYFMAVAIPAALISLVIPVKRTSNLVATIVGGNFFREKNLFRKSIACVIMLAGVFFIIY